MENVKTLWRSGIQTGISTAYSCCWHIPKSCPVEDMNTISLVSLRGTGYVIKLVTCLQFSHMVFYIHGDLKTKVKCYIGILLWFYNFKQNPSGHYLCTHSSNLSQRQNINNSSLVTLSKKAELIIWWPRAEDCLDLEIGIMNWRIIYNRKKFSYQRSPTLLRAFLSVFVSVYLFLTVSVSWSLSTYIYIYIYIINFLSFSLFFSPFLYQYPYICLPVCVCVRICACIWVAFFCLSYIWFNIMDIYLFLFQSIQISVLM